jgi:predicted CopG family antitoxin
MLMNEGQSGALPTGTRGMVGYSSHKQSFKYDNGQRVIMVHKTIAISEKIHKALEKLQGKDESINGVVSRLTGRMSLLEYVRATDYFSEELADKIEELYNERRQMSGREVNL